jgi:MFS transporter, CP family, cyanate transporter
VRHYFPNRVGLFTGLYSMSLTVGAALSAAVSVPAADRLGGGWRLSLGLWALPALAAALVWFAVLRRAGRRGSAGETPAVAPAARPARAALLHSRTAWALSVFFGLQAAGAYVVLGWLPQILRDAGVAPGPAGLLLALTPTVGIPFAFLIPSLAARLRDQSLLVVGLGVVGLGGYAGLWLAPAVTPWAWAVLLGISQAAFPLALTMIGLRGGSTGDVARLSAFAQGVGYLIATPGPLLFGALNQYTHGWSAPLAFMATLLVVQIVVGRAAARSAGYRSGTSANRAGVTGGRSGRT